MSLRMPARSGVALAALIAVCTLTACGPAGGQHAALGTTPEPSTSSAAPAPVEPTTSAPAPPPSTSATAPAPGRYTYVFPVTVNASYAHTHHDYPASDIMAACGAKALSPVNGTVLEVNRVDTWTKKDNLGPTRGGLSVSILGEDGVRYYGSHYSSINTGIEPGTPVTAGEAIAIVGRTGDAGACHIHFGISPACAKTGDWYNRRGLIWPWQYLDSWRAKTGKSPVAEVTAWQKKNGCPTKPLAP